MKKTSLAITAIITPLLATSLLAVSLPSTAETVRDCVMEGYVKRQSGSEDNVYVAFHSAKPADKDASCNMRKREKVQFKAPVDSAIKDMRPGTRVKYRYTEDSKEGATWKLQRAAT